VNLRRRVGKAVLSAVVPVLSVAAISAPRRSQHRDDDPRPAFEGTEAADGHPLGTVGDAVPGGGLIEDLNIRLRPVSATGSFLYGRGLSD